MFIKNALIHNFFRVSRCAFGPSHLKLTLMTAELLTLVRLFVTATSIKVDD